MTRHDNPPLKKSITLSQRTVTLVAPWKSLASSQNLAVDKVDSRAQYIYGIIFKQIIVFPEPSFLHRLVRVFHLFGFVEIHNILYGPGLNCQTAAQSRVKHQTHSA